MKKKTDSTCLIYIGLVVAAICIFYILDFLKDPEALIKIKYFFITVGLCIGSVYLFFVGLSIHTFISNAISEKKSWQGKDYPVRCFIMKMMPCERQDYIPKDLAEEPEQEITPPIYINVRLVGRGICIIARSNFDKQVETTSSDGIPFGLFNRDWSNPVIIPICYLDLFYNIITKLEGGLVTVLTPANSVGFEEEIPRIPSGHHLEIAIVFNAYIQKSNLNKTEYLNQPLKLKMVVLKDDSKYDAIATLELYETIYERKKPVPYDDDDSWMYRSRPIYW